MSYIPTTSSAATVQRDFHNLGSMSETISFAQGEDFAFYWHGTFAYPGSQSGAISKSDSMLAGGGYYQSGLDYRSYIWMLPDGRLRITGTGEALMADSDIGILTPDGTEYKIVISRSAGVVKAFINGSEITMTNTVNSNIAFTFRSFGWGYSSYYHTRGSVYEAIIFDQKLTNEEMQTLTTL